MQASTSAASAARWASLSPVTACTCSSLSTAPKSRPARAYRVSSRCVLACRASLASSVSGRAEMSGTSCKVQSQTASSIPGIVAIASAVARSTGK